MAKLIATFTGTTSATLSGIVAGDLLLQFIYSTSPGNSAPAAPSGWTALSQSVSFGSTLAEGASYKVAAGGETTSGAPTSFSGTVTHVVVMQFRPNQPGGTIAARQIGSTTSFNASPVNVSGPGSAKLNDNSRFVVGLISQNGSAGESATPPTAVNTNVVFSGVDTPAVYGTYISQQAGFTGTFSGSGAGSKTIAAGVYECMVVEISDTTTSAVNANASGAVITATVSLIGGAASGGARGTSQPEEQVYSSGAPVTYNSDPVMASSAIVVTASLIAGAASSGSGASGATLTAAASVVSGAASGDASVSGATPTAAASVVSGAASADASVSGATLTAAASVVSGAASGSSGGVAAVPHRAYRLKFLSAQNAGEVDLSWVKMFGAHGKFHLTDASLTSTAGGSPIASGTNGGALANVFNYATSWNGDNWWNTGTVSAGAVWVGWDFGVGNAQAVAAISLSGYTGWSPTSWQIQYCDDTGALTNWVDLGPVQGPATTLFGAPAGQTINGGSGPYQSVAQAGTTTAGHRYWRAYWPGGQASGSNDLGFYEITLQTAASTDRIRDWGLVRSSPSAGGGFETFRAFDRNTGTSGFTVADGTANARWWAFDLGQNEWPTQLVFDRYGGYFRPQLLWQYSDDAITWTTNDTLAMANASDHTITTYTLTGSAPTSVDGNASGATIVVTASLIPGTAAGAASVSGVLLSDTISLIAAAGTGSASAPAAVVVETCSILPGAASAASAATANGVTVPCAYSLLSGAASSEQSGLGAVLIEVCTVVAGAGSGAAAATGAVVGPTCAILPGTATGVSAATAAGAILPETYTLVAGVAAGNAIAPGQTVSLSETTIISGTVTSSGLAPAAIIPVNFSVAASGAATCGATAQGATVLFAEQVLIAGGATGGAATPVRVVSALASILNGAVTATANVDPDATLVTTISISPGIAFTFLGTPGEVLEALAEDRLMAVPAEPRSMIVAVEVRSISAASETRSFTIEPRMKKVS